MKWIVNDYMLYLWTELRKGACVRGAAACVWCREEITYRLPELDQRGSDEENVDSETSASTESLLDDKPSRVDTEGQY